MFNKEIEHIEKNQIENLELKNTLTELKKKNPIESFNNRPDRAEERISELKGRSFEISQLEEQKWKRKHVKKPYGIYGIQSHEQMYALWEFKKDKRERERR